MKKLSTFSGRLGLAALLGLSATAAWAVDPVNISNEEELRAIADNLAGEYTLTTDITVTGDWTPLGDDNHPFTGKLYGNGHVIKGIRVQNADRNENAFIGAIKDATITKLGLENVDILGDQNAGGLVGKDKGNNTISECYVTGKVAGRDHVGALIGGCGDALTRIENCYGITYSYSREHQAAGLVGTPVNLVIDKCYFGGTILGVKNCVGGIAALVDGGVQHEITNCFVAAPMMIRINTDMGDQHRILGKPKDKDDKLENDYALAGSWTGPYFAHSIIKSDNANSTDGADKSFAELTDPKFITETLGWSADVWTAEAGVLPRLKWQTSPVDVSKVFAIHAGDEVTVAPGATKQAKVGTLYGAKYSSSDESIATVDQEGTVTGVGKGTATITVTIPGNNTVKEASTTFTVNVNEVPVPINTVKLDGTGKLRCLIKDASGRVNDGEHEFYLNTREETRGKKWCENQSEHPWVIWEFTDYYRINRFWFEDAKHYEPNSQNTPDWKLEYSLDNENWTEILHKTNDGDRIYKDESFTPVEVRYLRATFTKADGAVRIYGVDIFGEYSRPIERENNLISVGKTILKSYDAVNMRETASNLINGYADKDHKWCFAQASKNDPIKFAVIDLEDTYDIEKIELVDCKAGGETNEPNLEDLNIYVSNTAPDLDLITPQGDTNTCWNRVVSATGVGIQDIKTYTFKSESGPEAEPKEVKAKAETAPVRARYVKLEVPFFIGETQTNNKFTARVPALNVYGTKYVVGTGVGGIDADDAAISVRTAAGAAVVEASDATVYVYDLAGRLISKKSVNGTAAIELPASIYLVRVVTPAGSKVAKVAIR